ncbi:MAG: hypothetical protein ABIF22_00315 [bacterium]
MKNNIIKISTITISFLILVAPVFVFAQITNPLGRDNMNIPELISSLLGHVVKIGGIVATFAFIWAGFLYVKAQGNPTELEKAKTVFINTCIGVAVLLGAQLIASIIKGTVDSLR